jgi:hypothetical protein
MTTGEAIAAMIVGYAISLLCLLVLVLLVALPVSLLMGGPSGMILGGLIAAFYGFQCMEVALQRASTRGASTGAAPDPAPSAAGPAPSRPAALLGPPVQ